MLYRAAGSLHAHVPGEHHGEQRSESVRRSSDLSCSDFIGKLRDDYLHAAEWFVLPSWNHDYHLHCLGWSKLYFHSYCK